jgi:hypothetical protein
MGKVSKARVLLGDMIAHEESDDYSATAVLGASVVNRAESVRDCAPDVTEALYGLLGRAFLHLKRFRRAVKSLEQELALVQQRMEREPKDSLERQVNSLRFAV